MASLWLRPSMITPDLHPDRFGSEHDPVLAGVASGLNALFPPIHNPGHHDQDDGHAGTTAPAGRDTAAEG